MISSDDPSFFLICRSLRPLSLEHLVTAIGVDTAKKGPSRLAICSDGPFHIKQIAYHQCLHEYDYVCLHVFTTKLVVYVVLDINEHSYILLSSATCGCETEAPTATPSSSNLRSTSCSGHQNQAKTLACDRPSCA